MRQIEFQVRGTVQGVNFRQWTRDQARALGLVGWVANTADGHVEGAAVGADAQVAQFRERLWEGPRVAKVDAVEVIKEHEVGEGAAEWTVFEVRR